MLIYPEGGESFRSYHLTLMTSLLFLYSFLKNTFLCCEVFSNYVQKCMERIPKMLSILILCSKQGQL